MIGEIFGDILRYFFYIYVIVIAIRIAVSWYNGIKNDRALYYKMPVGDREIMIKSILYILHSSKAPAMTSQVADKLDLSLYTADEALGRLIRHGYLEGEISNTMFPTVSTLRKIKLIDRGKKFYEDYYGSSGDTFNVAPWGVVVNKSELTDATITNSQKIVDMTLPERTVAPKSDEAP